jgi:hypothetical protein
MSVLGEVMDFELVGEDLANAFENGTALHRVTR